jgi:hypothetical protein
MPLSSTAMATAAEISKTVISDATTDSNSPTRTRTTTTDITCISDDFPAAAVYDQMLAEYNEDFEVGKRWGGIIGVFIHVVFRVCDTGKAD